MTAAELAQARRRLVALSHQLGDPTADLAILGEGNTSAALGDGTFLVKASGTSLGRIGEEDLVRLEHGAILDLVDDPDLDEHDQAGLADRMRAATVRDPDAVAGPAKPASIETMLHALGLALPGVRVVGHTHPTAVNGLLCSDRAADLVAGVLFPDQAVVCGPHAPLIPYAEPGLPLARAVRRGIDEHLDAHGTPPRLVHLANHGIVAFGENSTQVLAVTAMAVKAARVLSAVLAVGSPRYLDPDTVARLAGRADEKHRQRLLTAEEAT